MSLLRDLDDRYLPALARRVDDLVRRLPTPPEPQGPAPVVVRLRRVDDRWTRRGPLALLRDVPQLGYVALAALILVNFVVVRARTHHTRPAAEAAQGPQASDGPDAGDGGGRLGPDIDQKVPEYIAAARARLSRAAAGAPDGEVVAVVDLTSYRTPEQVAALLSPLPALVVFYRAPLKLGLTPVRRVGVTDLVRDTHRQMLREAAALREQVARIEEINPTIVNDPVQKADQERDARNFTAELNILKGKCACVFAVVVRTRLRLLADLSQNPAVRVIDVGEIGVEPDAYEFAGLLPEEKTIVTGGNQA